VVGTSISHYKVIEKIGEGGMGEVYRATDTKLNRDVALEDPPRAVCLGFPAHGPLRGRHKATWAEIRSRSNL